MYGAFCKAALVFNGCAVMVTEPLILYRIESEFVIGSLRILHDIVEQIVMSCSTGGDALRSEDYMF